MNLSTTIRDLKSELAKVEARHKQLADAVRILESFDKKQPTQPTAQPAAKPKKRKRYFLFSTTCIRCGNLFKAKRHPAKYNPARGVLYCHKPCTSSMYKQDQRKAKSPKDAYGYDEKLSRTLLPGDPLRATIGQH